MSLPRRPKTEEEVEAEVQAYGLTNETAAAIVRLGNTLKGSRKLEREHIGLLTPGRRLHPPSPLSQPVWKQADVEDSRLPGLDVKVGIHHLKLRDKGADQTEHPESSIGASQTPEPLPSSRSRRRALSPIQEEEDVVGSERVDKEKWEDGNANPSENSSTR